MHTIRRALAGVTAASASLLSSAPSAETAEATRPPEAAEKMPPACELEYDLDQTRADGFVVRISLEEDALGNPRKENDAQLVPAAKAVVHRGHGDEAERQTLQSPPASTGEFTLPDVMGSVAVVGVLPGGDYCVSFVELGNDSLVE